MPAGYENQDGEDISSDIYIYHPYGLETWLVITNVRDDYNEDREIDLDEIKFEDMVNHFINQHLPGLHINNIKFSIRQYLAQVNFIDQTSKLKQEMYKDSVSFFSIFFMRCQRYLDTRIFKWYQ